MPKHLDEANRTGEISALKGLLQSYEPQKHSVHPQAAWETPRYVLRAPLRYTLLARALHQLLVTDFWTTEDLAEAFGLRLSDVEAAVRVFRRRLEQLGHLCRGGCGAPVDPAFGEYCSRRCHASAP